MGIKPWDQPQDQPQGRRGMELDGARRESIAKHERHIVGTRRQRIVALRRQSSTQIRTLQIILPWNPQEAEPLFYACDTTVLRK